MSNDRPQLELLVVDTETGGLDPEENPLLEVAMQHLTLTPMPPGRGTGTPWVLVHGLKFHSLVAPPGGALGSTITDEAAKVNGFYHGVYSYNQSDWRWKDAPSLDTVIRNMLFFLGTLPNELTWVGSNVNFDLRFLESNFRNEGVPFPGKPKFQRRALSTESLCWPLLAAGQVDSLGLQSLRNWAGLAGQQHHTATQDVADVCVVLSHFMKWLDAPAVNNT
jgi:DNA polymerase III epsilon subunit-like protein